MFPVLFEIGGFAIPAYGVMLAIAFLASVFLLRREAERMGQNAQNVADTAIIGLLIGLLGSKLLLILIDLDYYLSNPEKLLGTLRSAGVMYGGVIAGVLAVVWFVRKKKMPMWDTLDLMAPFLALGIGLGRLGCLLVGCCHGVPYEGPLKVVFPEHPYCEAPANIGLFPIQVISFLGGLALFFFLLWLLRRRSFLGQIAASYFVLYSMMRGVIEFWRGDTVRGLWFGDTISTSQIISIMGVILGVVLFLNLRKAEST